MRTTRRGLLLGAGAGAIGMSLPGGSASAIPFQPPTTMRAALHRLRQGNARWAAGVSRHPHQSMTRRREVAFTQEPFCVVFSCIDSRVPPELVFDQGIGDLFVIRTAAHTLSPLVTGSIEYGPSHGVPLVVVLGHRRCGAVLAAVDAFRSGAMPPAHLADVVTALKPAYDEARQRGGDLVEATVRAHTRLTVAALERDPVLTTVLGGYYDLDSGRVAFHGDPDSG